MNPNSRGNYPPGSRTAKLRPARKVVLQCSNCSRIGHELKRCVGPVNAFGVIDGCLMCNKKDHVLFECVKAWKSEGNQRHLLMLGRNQKAMISWPTELTEHPVGQALSARTRPKIWTPSFALQYQLENQHHWRDYIYARTWQRDLPLAQGPAWDNPSFVIYLKDRLERGLTRNASGLGRRPQSELPPPSAQYFPPPMMPQLPSYNLMNLAPAGVNNDRDRKKLAIKAASNAKFKDRSQSPKVQTETKTHCERSPLLTPHIKLEDPTS
ncbi:uncharacterized protein EAE97_005358 [Botrytis byssoidea]|uniref:CCHC-type domain-containing protein n=1 Tax=Botrytis byssoidea TaxID=139641 RepID=A0A9P5IN38_9HELO|nr:uncharacterized protein EAE97_005358 [Botrytis byssoidea]KAF7944725.1 hypothetical protein EAE97_005358 [Botrytis byssoidea]